MIDDLRLLTLFYTDDVVIFSETADGLQKEIDKLYQYCERWKLSLNTDKSQIVVFGKSSTRRNPTWKFGDHNLKVTNKTQYLGILLSSTGSFYQTQITVFALYRKLGHFNQLKPEIIIDLLDKFIAPILNYGCEVWGFHMSPGIEHVHTMFCKKVLRVMKSTQSDFVYRELGRMYMQNFRFVRVLKY